MKYLSVFVSVVVVLGFFAVFSPVFGAPPLCSTKSQYTVKVEGVADEAACGNIPGGFWCTITGVGDECHLPGTSKVQDIGGALGLINKITNWLVAILVLFGIFYGLMGAFQFLGSGGDDKKLTEGKKKIYYAVGGVALGLLVKGVITLLVSFVGTLGA